MQFQWKVLKTGTLVAKEQELHLHSPKHKVVFKAVSPVWNNVSALHFSWSGQHLRKHVFTALGGPKPALALFSLSSEKFHTKAMSAQCLASNAHTTLVLRTSGKLWPHQHSTEPSVTRCALNTICCFISVSQVTAWLWLCSSYRASLECRRTEFVPASERWYSHSLSKAAVSPHPNV